MNMTSRNSRTIRQIKIHTKAGDLKVNNDCNEDIQVHTNRYFERVRLKCHLNHRSDDIEAETTLDLDAEAARYLGSALIEAANDLE
jgi:vancomycin resistance protein YoaR